MNKGTGGGREGRASLLWGFLGAWCCPLDRTTTAHACTPCACVVVCPSVIVCSAAELHLIIQCATDHPSLPTPCLMPRPCLPPVPSHCLPPLPFSCTHHAHAQASSWRWSVGARCPTRPPHTSSASSCHACRSSAAVRSYSMRATWTRCWHRSGKHRSAWQKPESCASVQRADT